MSQTKQLEKKVNKLERKVNKYVKKTDELYKEVIEEGHNPRGILIKCDKCGYSWKTKSKLNLVSCPNCCRKIKLVKESEVIKKVMKNEMSNM